MYTMHLHFLILFLFIITGLLDAKNYHNNDSPCNDSNTKQNLTSDDDSNISEGDDDSSRIPKDENEDKSAEFKPSSSALNKLLTPSTSFKIRAKETEDFQDVLRFKEDNIERNALSDEDDSSPSSFEEKQKNIFVELPSLKQLVTRKFSSEMRKSFSVLPYTGPLTPYNAENIDSSEIIFDGCTPIKSWNIFRHGTRYPSYDQVKAMTTRLPEIKLQIIFNNIFANNPCYSTRLVNWTFNENISIEEDKEKLLSIQGKLQMKEMGERFRSRFNNFMPKQFDDSIKVKFTGFGRTKDSAHSFLTGLFGDLPENDEWFETPSKEDKILKYDTNCTRWKKEHQKSDFNAKIIELFKYGKEVTKVRKNIEKRCELRKGTLDNDDVVLIYKTCAFEISWGIKKSPWCDFFSVPDFEVIEYIEDLDLWTNHGYGDALSTLIPCVLFNDMLNHLYGTSEKNHAFYFTHLTAISKFLAFLQLFKDPFPLLPTNFDLAKNRKWRASEFGVFATNVTFVRFTCENNKEYILPMHQEKPIKFPNYSTMMVDLYSLCTIHEMFDDGINKCYYDQWCRPTEKEIEEETDKTIDEKKENKNIMTLQTLNIGNISGDVEKMKSKKANNDEQGTSNVEKEKENLKMSSKKKEKETTRES